MQLTINGFTFDVQTAQALREAVAGSAHLHFREIWLNVDGGPALSALLNKKLGWLMYLRSPDDAGFSSRNPTYSGSQNALFEYELSNSQRDEYPASWALPETEIIDALIYFLERQERSPAVTWHDDGV